MEKGIITGCDQKFEWLIPWWWENYSKHNSLPVVFFDFGMSKACLDFCKSKGTVISALDEYEINLHLNKEKKEVFEYLYSPEQIYYLRKIWFKKPIAANKSPFDLTLWIDIDCQVRSNISTVFDLIDDSADILIRKLSDRQHHHFRLTLETYIDEILYESSVFLFRKSSHIVKKWLELCLNSCIEFPGDQEALSRAIYLLQPKVSLLDEIYNCSGPYVLGTVTSENKPIVIAHYAGFKGKEILRKNLNLKPLFLELQPISIEMESKLNT